MSLLGQKAKYSLRANHFRCYPNNGHRADRPNWSIRPKPEVGGLLFDHLVGAGAFVPAAFAMWQRRRDFPHRHQ